MKHSPTKYHNRYIDKMGESFTAFLESQGHKVVDVTPKTNSVEDMCVCKCHRKQKQHCDICKGDWETLQAKSDSFNTKFWSYFKEEADPKKEYGFGWDYWFVNPMLLNEFFHSLLQQQKEEIIKKVEEWAIARRKNIIRPKTADEKRYPHGYNQALKNLLSFLSEL